MKITSGTARHIIKCIGLSLLITIGRSPLIAQQYKGFESLFTPPLNYVVKYTAAKLSIDGKLNEQAWQTATWTSNFVDIEGDLKPKPAFDTKVKMLWNDEYLFVAAQLQEQQLWAKQTHHDDVIFRDNDFEIFIDPLNEGHRYFEIEVNALNKIFDLFINKPYRNGGDALVGWNADGLKSGILLEGTLNKPNDTDKSWTLEMAIPLKSLWMGYPFKKPQEGSIWRINFSRVEWDTKVVNGKVEKLTDAKANNLPERNWVWSPQGVVNMHYPERWGYLQFTKGNNKTFVLPYIEKQKNSLWLLYYKQKRYLQQNGRYALTFAELEMEPNIVIEGKTNQVTMEAGNHQFKAWISAGTTISINDEGLIEYKKRQ
jgi:hypothetical protein